MIFSFFLLFLLSSVYLCFGAVLRIGDFRRDLTAAAAVNKLFSENEEMNVEPNVLIEDFSPLCPCFNEILSFLNVHDTSSVIALNSEYKRLVSNFVTDNLRKYFQKMFVSRTLAVNRRVLAFMQKHFGDGDLLSNPDTHDNFIGAVAVLMVDAKDYWSYLLLNYLKTIIYDGGGPVVGIGSKEQNVSLLIILCWYVSSPNLIPKSFKIYRDAVMTEPKNSLDAKSYFNFIFMKFLVDFPKSELLISLKNNPAYTRIEQEEKPKFIEEVSLAIICLVMKRLYVNEQVCDYEEYFPSNPAAYKLFRSGLSLLPKGGVGSFAGNLFKVCPNSILGNNRADISKYFWCLEESTNPFSRETLLALIGDFSSQPIATPISDSTIMHLSSLNSRIAEIFSCPSPNFEQLKMILEIAKMKDLSSVQALENSLVHFIFKYASPMVLNAILSETEKPVNVFIKFKGTIRSVFTHLAISEEKYLIYFQSLKTKHPLPLLFLHRTSFRRIFPKLESLFDFDMQIDMDCDLIHCIEMEAFRVLKNQGLEVGKFYRARMSFREILDFQSIEASLDQPEVENNPLSLNSFIMEGKFCPSRINLN